jgi:hypothetical protein
MGDHSSATRFQIGDTVKVVEDVMKMGRSLKGLDGIVVETWEKLSNTDASLHNLH